MFGDLFGKLQEAQQKMNDSKERLKLITVGRSGQRRVKVLVTGAREVQSLEIAPALLSTESERRAGRFADHRFEPRLKNAENAWEAEMKNVAGGMLGGMWAFRGSGRKKRPGQPGVFIILLS